MNIDSNGVLNIGDVIAVSEDYVLLESHVIMYVLWQKGRLEESRFLQLDDATMIQQLIVEFHACPSKVLAELEKFASTNFNWLQEKYSEFR